MYISGLCTVFDYKSMLRYQTSRQRIMIGIEPETNCSFIALKVLAVTLNLKAGLSTNQWLNDNY